MPEMTEQKYETMWHDLRDELEMLRNTAVYTEHANVMRRAIKAMDDVESRHAEPSKPAPDHGDPKDWKWNNAEPHCVTCAHDDTAECHDCHGRNKYEYDDNRKPERRTCETCNNQFTQCWNGHIVCIDGSDWTPRKEES